LREANDRCGRLVGKPEVIASDSVPLFVDKLVALSAESLKILIATLPSCVAYCPESDFEQRHDVRRVNAYRERRS